MKISAMVSRDLEKGSTKYRLAQYLDFLSRREVTVDFLRRDERPGTALEKVRQADLFFNQKCLISCRQSRRLIAASRKVVFDFDDAIYTRPGRPFSAWTQWKVNRRFRLWLREADLVTAANGFLARAAQAWTDKVKVVPMALDLELWRPRPAAPRDEVVIGWAGAPVNVPLLERLDPVLGDVLRRHPQVRLAVFSGRKPRLTCPFDYVEFQPGCEPDFVRDLDIGLLPLVHEEFTLGKSPIKALQYLACGLPVVGNVWGATTEILDGTNSFPVNTDREWHQALQTLIADRGRARAMGLAGREKVAAGHDFRTVAEQLFGLLAGI